MEEELVLTTIMVNPNHSRLCAVHRKDSMNGTEASKIFNGRTDRRSKAPHRTNSGYPPVGELGFS